VVRKFTSCFDAYDDRSEVSTIRRSADEQSVIAVERGFGFEVGLDVRVGVGVGLGDGEGGGGEVCLLPAEQLASASAVTTKKPHRRTA